MAECSGRFKGEGDGDGRHPCNGSEFFFSLRPVFPYKRHIVRCVHLRQSTTGSNFYGTSRFVIPIGLTPLTDTRYKYTRLFVRPSPRWSLTPSTHNLWAHATIYCRLDTSSSQQLIVWQATMNAGAGHSTDAAASVGRRRRLSLVVSADCSADLLVSPVSFGRRGVSGGIPMRRGQRQIVRPPLKPPMSRFPYAGLYMWDGSAGASTTPPPRQP